jgi:hypothetical protein
LFYQIDFPDDESDYAKGNGDPGSSIHKS